MCKVQSFRFFRFLQSVGFPTKWLDFHPVSFVPTKWLDFHPVTLVGFPSMLCYILQNESQVNLYQNYNEAMTLESVPKSFFRSHPISAPCFQTIGKPPPGSWAPFHYWQQKSGSSSETLWPPCESTYWPSNEDCLSPCCRLKMAKLTIFRHVTKGRQGFPRSQGDPRVG